MKTSKYEVEEEVKPVFVPNTAKFRFASENNNLCRYNDAVDCNTKDRCNNCGWNPVVSRRRLIDIVEYLAKTWRYLNPNLK